MRQGGFDAIVAANFEAVFEIEIEIVVVVKAFTLVDPIVAFLPSNYYSWATFLHLLAPTVDSAWTYCHLVLIFSYSVFSF